MVQGQVDSRITNKSDGLERKVDQFLEDLKNFKVDNPEVQKQMEQMRAGVERIKDEHLAPAEQGLSRASKALDEAQAKEANKAEGKPGDAKGKADADKAKQAAEQVKQAAAQAKSALAKTEENQAAIDEELRKMLDALSEFNSIREMIRDAERLLKEPRGGAQAIDRRRDPS